MTLLDFISSNWAVQIVFCIVNAVLLALIFILRALRENNIRKDKEKPADFQREMQKTREVTAARERELAMKLSIKNETVAAIENNHLG